MEFQRPDFGGDMKVMIAIPVLLVGGTEQQVLSTVRVLVAAGYTVAVCCYYEFDVGIVKLMESAGAEVVLLQLERTRHGYGLGDMFVLVRALVAIFRRYRPDIVHVQYLAPGLLPILAARLAGMRTVFSTVHIAGNVAYGRKAKFFLRAAAGLCTAFFCVSKGVERFWFGEGEVFEPGAMRRRRHCTIYNGVDTEAIASAAATTNRTQLCGDLGINGRHVVGVVGRLAYQKGHAVLLDAMVEIIKRFPDVFLIIVGDGPEKDALQDKVRRFKIEQHLRWLGARPYDEVLRLYSVMNVVAMPSLYEGFGLAAVEAMAAEKPVVGTRVEGLEEVIDHEVTGYLVPPGDSKALAVAICDLLAQPSLARRMGQRGKARAERLFSFNRFRTTILAAYQELAKMPIAS